jgi:hypothetical protein
VELEPEDMVVVPRPALPLLPARWPPGVRLGEGVVAVECMELSWVPSSAMDTWSSRPSPLLSPMAEWRRAVVICTDTAQGERMGCQWKGDSGKMKS